MATELFGLRLTRKEINQIIKPRRLIIASLGALAVNFVLLPPFEVIIPWEGWNVILSTVGGMILVEYLD